MRNLHSFFLFALLLIMPSVAAQFKTRHVVDFNPNWKFSLTDSTTKASAINYNDQSWRTLNLPHDWSIESDFGKDYPATAGGGALPGGIGWYRKSFLVSKDSKNQNLFIEFDGVYRNSEVWINGQYLGKRPNGYISFKYDLTPYIKFGAENVIAVKADNSKQPNSRWYSGSGIYRNVRLVYTNSVYVDMWGTYVTTPNVNADSADVAIQTSIKNDMRFNMSIKVEQTLFDASGNQVAQIDGPILIGKGLTQTYFQKLVLKNPILWSIENPYLYKLVTRTYAIGRQTDEYTTNIGIRTFKFDVKKGFSLNGKSLKINGVCNHHDLGALGVAVNERAIERQLQILKGMGVNGIRTAHNPPAPELLDLCDRMGFIVMNEAFDMWFKKKTKYDYSADFEKWHERDLTDQLLRDRNHPSIFIWSIGNEVGEQWGENASLDNVDLQKANISLNNRKVDDDKEGKLGKNAILTRHLADIVKKIDPTRPITAACNGTDGSNPLLVSEALDIIGFNYHEKEYSGMDLRYPTTPFISTESVSALQTRGYYENPSDSIIICPTKWDVPYVNPTQKCSAYDNCHVPWGTTHEDTWRIVKKWNHVSGQYIWTGFDYLGEPTPYWWPSRSSFFGIVDLAGFPKDVYYMYQSEWTTKDVLHIYPHWNWEAGKIVDIWAYYNNADEVELFLDGKSLGKKTKTEDQFHVMWRVPFTPGTLKAVSRRNGNIVLSKEIKTAETPVSIRLTADRSTINSDGKDLSFVTVELIDKNGVASPLANELVKFTIEGEAIIAGTDNGDQNDHKSLKKPERNLFFGKCMAIVQSTSRSGTIKLKASVDGLPVQTIDIISK